MDDRSATGFVWHELYMWHDTGRYAGILPSGDGVLEPGEHAENPATKRRLKNLLDVAGLTHRLVAIDPREAIDDELTLVHTREYVAAVRAMSEHGGGDARMETPFGHTPFGAGGFRIAALAAGGVIEAVDAVLAGRVRNAYALVRPPGHHAEPGHGLGFCIFNNGAIGARHAMRRRGVGRVAFVDWDVHHGNGAQRIFWNERDVLTISIHQDGAFPPNSGAITDRGEGPGHGCNINVPLPPGSGVGAYRSTFERVVLPALRKFRPELIIVPSGFDAGAFDPLARMMLHSECYRDMTRMMMEVAGEVCNGRLVMCHEGGYDEDTVPFLGLAVIEQLSGIRTEICDPFLEIFAGLPYQELQPHQKAVIAAAAQMVNDL